MKVHLLEEIQEVEDLAQEVVQEVEIQEVGTEVHLIETQEVVRQRRPRGDEPSGERWIEVTRPDRSRPSGTETKTSPRLTDRPSGDRSRKEINSLFFIKF